MVTISGKHFIFTRVEQEYSPKGQPGFQVYYASASLPAADLQVLESTVKSFVPSKEDIVRRQYFRLPSNDFAFVNTIVKDHPKISDRVGRGGGLLAHGIIIDSQQFSKILNNPFHVFDRFDFLKSLEDMVREFNQIESREPACVFNADPYTEVSGGQELAPQAVALYQFSAPLGNPSRPVLLIGQNQEIEKLLRAAIQFSGISSRPSCAFDTCVDNCPVSPNLFWAIGSSFNRDEPYSTIRVPAESTRLTPAKDCQNDLYCRWLQYTVGKDPQQAYRHAAAAQMLAHAFQNRRPFSTHAIALEAGRSFFDAHQELVVQNLRKAVADLTTPSLAEKIVKFMLQSSIDVRVLLSIVAVQTISYGDLAPVVRSWLATSALVFPQMGKHDWTVLQNFAGKANDSVTLFWSAALGQHDKVRQQCSQAMSKADYQAALALLFSAIPPRDYLPASRVNLQQLFARILPELHNMEDQVFTEFTLELLRLNSLEFLDELSPKISALDNRSLTQIESKLPRLPQTSLFLNSVQKRRKAIGRPEGLKGIFYREEK